MASQRGSRAMVGAKAASRGITVIEMLVTAALLGLLASVALPLMAVAAQRQKEDELRDALWSIRDAIDAYRQASDEGRIDLPAGATGYPPTLDVLVSGTVDLTSPDHTKHYFLRRIPRDPMCDCPGRSDVQTWATRSYASPPDAPVAGADVYDVHSRSDRVGLNGIPYSRW